MCEASESSLNTFSFDSAAALCCGTNFDLRYGITAVATPDNKLSVFVVSTAVIA